MFKLNYQGSNRDEVEKEVSSAFNSVSNFFEIKNDNVVINIFDSRGDFDKAFGEKTAPGKSIPVWLNEGTAGYIAKQHLDPERLYFVEDNFCKELGTDKGWDGYVKYGAYKIAALFVNFLIKKYSFEKIKELLKSLDKVYYYKNFQPIFFKVYGKNINEIEDEFIKFL